MTVAIYFTVTGRAIQIRRNTGKTVAVEPGAGSSRNFVEGIDTISVGCGGLSIDCIGPVSKYPNVRADAFHAVIAITKDSDSIAPSDAGPADAYYPSSRYSGGGAVSIDA